MGEVRTTRRISATILTGSAVSEAIALQPNEKIIGVLTPAVWDAADIGIDISQDGSTNWKQAVDGTQTAVLIFFRLGANIPVNAATYNTTPADHIPYYMGASFERLHCIDPAGTADVLQTGDRAVVVFIGQEK